MSRHIYTWEYISARLIEQGWRIEDGVGAHKKCYPPDRSLPQVNCAPFSTDKNVLRHIVKDLKRSGFKWEDDDEPAVSAPALLATDNPAVAQVMGYVARHAGLAFDPADSLEVEPHGLRFKRTDRFDPRDPKTLVGA